MKISIFGTGYVGLTTGACLSNLGHDVLCVDINPDKINQLNSGDVPFYEPGLKELVLQNTTKNRLKFTTDTTAGLEFGEVIFNCVGTPSLPDGSADLQYVFKVAEDAAKFAKGYKILINKSTVPPGTAHKCQNLIKKVNPDSQVEVVSNPEFLAEGKAVHDFTHPDKIVVGAKTEKAFALVRQIYTGRVRTYIPILETDWATAEMIKYANNSFLATKISFINEVANICDKVGADVRIISQAMGMDYRINPKFLNPGVGYGGSCFPKDVRALAQTAHELGYDAKLLQEVSSLNDRQKNIILQKITKKFGNLTNITFTIWGVSFKPKTSDIRESSSIVIINSLLAAGAKIILYDPIAMNEAKLIFKDKIQYAESLISSAQDSSAIILVTEWDEFRNIDLATLSKVMHSKVIFDGRNIYEPELIREEGFEYYGIGRQ
jgi:UDPglucose 6-dehydrogenase